MSMDGPIPPRSPISRKGANIACAVCWGIGLTFFLLAAWSGTLGMAGAIGIFLFICGLVALITEGG